MIDLKMLPLGAGMAVAAAVVMSPVSAQAITLTLTDDALNTYQVSDTTPGSFADLLSQLGATSWWGNSTLAEDLADNANIGFGLPNIPSNLSTAPNNEGAYFAYAITPTGPNGAPRIAAWNWDGDANRVEVDVLSNEFFTPYVWAVEETAVVTTPAAAVPTPALLPAMLGMGASIVRKRKKQAAA